MESDPHTYAGQQRVYLDKFLKTRKSEETRAYAQTILAYLTERMSADTQGWVRSRDLVNDLVSTKKIPNASTFYKLLSDLVDANLVEPKTGEKEKPGPGPLPKYYRATIAFLPELFMTREELLEKNYKLFWEKTKLVGEIGVARELLKECHEGEEGYNAKKAIIERLNEAVRIRDPTIPVDINGDGTLGFLDWIEAHRNKTYGKKSKS